MGAFALLKRYWNLILTFSLGFVTIVSAVLAPPFVDSSTFFGSSDIISLARLILGSVTLLLLFILNAFNKKIHARKWWFLAILLLVTSCFLFYNYQRFYSRHTVVDTLNERKVIFGDSVLAIAKPVYDSVARNANSKADVSRIMLEQYSPEPSEIWTPESIEKTTSSILYHYLAAIISMFLTVVLAAQALYCQKQPA